jgi:UDP-N-acetylglucosamine/UDP-N-acetylgalactosamine diphosphorylase
VAGGQGTRLGFNGPKGCYPITPVEEKSLFQLFAEKILALQLRYGTHLFWYIMTSSENHNVTKVFFQQHNFFGLHRDQIQFFIQAEIPSLDLDGKLILGTEGKIFKNPNGHGGSIKALHESGALKDMAKKGIDQIFYFQVDNPLVKIGDPLFIGAHVANKAEMSTKVVKKVDPKERVGIIGRINGRLGCIEYSELPPEQAKEKKEDGNLRFSSANIAIHMLKRNFVEDLANQKGISLPYHIAVKEIECLQEQQGALVHHTIKGLKFEMFIFDALGCTQNSITLEVKREEEFAPVKNHDGLDSPETAKKALINLNKRWLQNAGKLPEDSDDLIIEVSPLYALDEKEFQSKCKSPLSHSTPLYLG